MRTQVQNAAHAMFNANAMLDANAIESPADSTPAVGEIVGDYRLLSVLGEGGMACVYRAQHVRNGKQVAIKVLSANRSQSAIASRNFALEAEAAQRIAHTNIVRVAEHIASHPKYKLHVMELLDASTLRAVMDAEPEMAVPRAINIASQVASALAATHAAGYVHRDIKPENVMVDADGKVTLIDFGAVKQADETIVSGEPIVGTPLYMAPEQMWGHVTTAQTDIYAFGLILYEMLAGSLPFKARRFVELREERSTQDPTPLRITLREKVRMARATTVHAMAREVPAALEALVMACLARDPAKRPASMTEIVAQLATMGPPARAQLAAMSPSAKAPPRLTRPRPIACRHSSSKRAGATRHLHKALPMGDMMRFVCAATLFCLAGCAHSKQQSNEPPKATMTATGDTEIDHTANTAAEPITVIPECKKVVSCYNALSRDLCAQSTEDCTASFRVTTPVDKPETCKRLLEQAEETAKPFMNTPKYKMPSECG